MILAASLAFALATIGPPGGVAQHLKILGKSGAFPGTVNGGVGAFAGSVAPLGDVDGDGIGDMVVGGPGCDDGGNNNGAVFICFLRADGTVRASQKISQTSGGFFGALNGSFFGSAVAGVGDIDSDGVPDLAVGGPQGNGSLQGDVWVIRLKKDGKVKTQQLITLTSIAFAHAGGALAALGDVDGDGVGDLAVGGYPSLMWIARLKADGSLKSSTWTLPGDPQSNTIACAIDRIGDFDGDGVEDLVLGEHGANGSGSYSGAIRLMFLNHDGTKKSMLKIDGSTPALAGRLEAGDNFGNGVASLGDIDGDGHVDVAVGAWGDSDGAVLANSHPGAVWILFLDPAAPGAVKGVAKISRTEGGLLAPIGDNDGFGTSLAALGDPDGDGAADVAVCAWGDDDAAPLYGAVWRLSLHGSPPSPWQDVGQGLASASFAPKLVAGGHLDPQHVASVWLSGARPNAAAALIIGNQAQSLPLACGVLVPSPQILVPIVTDASGGVEIHGSPGPLVPQGFTHWMQYWIADPSGPCGLSASNAVAGTKQ